MSKGMKVFVAGATGAIGQQLVPQLVEAGHEVTGMTRTESKADSIREMGAAPVVADALDSEAVSEAIGKAEPEVVINELTSIPDEINPKKIDEEFELTNRLRTEGNDNLILAAKAAGARRFISQGFAPWSAPLDGARVNDEDEPLPDDPPADVVPILDAIRRMESAVVWGEGIEGLVLRYGGFYGPGTSLATDPDTAMVEMVRKRKMPIVGGGTGVWSFIHIADAASATVAALDRGGPGIYNVTDDEPAEVSVWLPVLAETLGAKRPYRVPRFVGRLAAGEAGAAMMTRVRGSSSEKAKRELGWEPRFASWREGFRDGLS